MAHVIRLIASPYLFTIVVSLIVPFLKLHVLLFTTIIHSEMCCQTKRVYSSRIDKVYHTCISNVLYYSTNTYAQCYQLFYWQLIVRFVVIIAIN